MRGFLNVLFAGGLIICATPALGAPTCQNINGETVRCGTLGAMPVGWTLPAQQRPQSDPAITPVQLMELISALGVLFALLALMPEFDGSHPEDWDREEGDQTGRR